MPLTFVLAQGQVHNLCCNAITDHIFEYFYKGEYMYIVQNYWIDIVT